MKVVAQEIGVTVDRLERLRSEALGAGKKSGGWPAVARFEAVLATVAMSEEERNAWCRQHGVYPSELWQWRDSATQAPTSKAMQYQR
mgnify:CR=1 FL=1